MKNKINLVVACGGGIFTTTVVTEKLKTILRENRINFSISPHKITEIPNIKGADLIIVTGKTKEQNKQGTPVMLGMPLFTGVGAEKFINEFLAKVNEILD